MDSSIRQYYVGLKDNGSVSINNPMYQNTYTYPSNVDGSRIAYVNDGSALDVGSSLNASVLTEDSIVTAKLVDKDGTSLAETGAIIRQFQNNNGDAYWYLGYVFNDVTLINDSQYYIEVTADGKDLG